MNITRKRLAVLAATASFLFFLGWTIKTRTARQDVLTIQTIGLETFGIQLDAPYGARSIHHALIVNNSRNHLLACDIEFEFTRQDEKVSTSQKIVVFADLLEANHSKRKDLLKSGAGIPPHSKMLVGLGVEPDLVRVTGELPELGQSLIEGTRNPSVKLKKLVIRLNAVVLENGQIVGPSADKFSLDLKEVLSKGPKQ